MSLARTSLHALRLSHTRQFSFSAAAWMPRARPVEKRPNNDDIVTIDDIAKQQTDDDTSAAGHVQFRQQRQLLYYMRLIEHEMPKLVAFRKPFVPPPPSNPLVVRSISYGGEEHPAALKRTIVVPVSRLPLKNAAAIHKFKLLAGVRWSPEPPRDSGIGRDEANGQHGYIKISCEDFPQPAMNMKWASDALDRLTAEANNAKDSFKDIPLDTRHIDARARKAKKGDHFHGRKPGRPTIQDFPKEWLPAQPVKTESLPTASA